MSVKLLSSGNGRINFFIVLIFILGGLITHRLFNLTQIRHLELADAARDQYTSPTALLAGRGNIYFGDLSSGQRKLAATNRSSFHIYANKKEISDLTDASSKIAPVLSKETEEILNLLSEKNKTYQVIAKDLDKEKAVKIQSLKIQGVRATSAVERFYATDLAGAVLGFVGFEGDRRAGQYGIEAYYDDVLSGRERGQEWFDNRTYSWLADLFGFGGKKVGEKDNGQEGRDILLTVDYNVQSFVEITLNNLLKKWGAESGLIIVQEPATGKILAAASRPIFDPNNYANYKLEDFINPAVQKVFEPGSSFKPITMAAALDIGAVTPETTYTDRGAVQIGGYTIKNFDEGVHGVQTMRGVLQKSLNTGAIFVEERTGDDAFLNYVVAFGFGQRSGVDLPGEISGNISNLYSGRKINFATASFGQGIAVTPLQLINAYSAIANGGKLMRPYVVEKIINRDGSATNMQPKVIGSPINNKASILMKSMLIDVVEKGFDKARIKGYDVAGKTGTAQIPDETGGYLGGDQFIHNFVGFAPAYSPRFTVLIRMDKPKGIKFAADSLSPVFGEIARYLIRYFNIPPTRS